MGGGSTTITNTAPRIAGLQLQTSAYGRCVPIVYGTQRLTANIFWYDDFNAIAKTTTTQSGGGGKGGGGSVTTQNTTYSYTASLMFGLCEGGIEGVGNIWVDKAISSLEKLGLTLFKGDYSQTPWGFLASMHPDKALAYRGNAYVCNSTFSLGDSAQLPNISYEVKGFKIFNGLDANPKEIILDFLTNQNYGLGFPANKIGDLTVFSNYCLANGILLSPMFDEQQAGVDHLSDLLKACNSSFVWSEDKLKIVPYGDSEATGNGATYTPNTTPIYDLTDNDFIDNEEPIKITRSTNADAYNHIKIEFLNRGNQYNAEIAEAKDLANIDMYGLRPSDSIQMKSICDATVAKKIAQLILQRTLYIRNKYEFKLSWKYCLLEPMDLVTLTDSGLGLDKLPVRITEISEDDEGVLSFTAEDFPFGVSSATLYPSQENQGKKMNYLAPAGAINQPAIFEPPLLLSNGYEVWIGVSGVENWGGADLWVSYDGDSYAYLTNVNTPARTGYSTSDWNGGVLSVDLSECNGALLSVSEALAMVGSEIIKYSTATLAGSNKYNLTVIERGLYGTAEESHAKGSRFIRLDSAIGKQPYTTDMVGRTLYYKALSYNIFGGAKQSLVDVEPFQYKIKGTADASPLPNVTGIATYYQNNQQVITWRAVTDKFRSPIDYEIRRGDSWGKAYILGRTSTLNFNAGANGMYLVKAHYKNLQGVDVYSEDEAIVMIEGATIVKNVVATYDERALGWTGTTTDGATIMNENLVLGGVDSVATFGSYISNHVLVLDDPKLCRLSINYSVGAENIKELFDDILDFDKVADLDGNFSEFFDAKIMISLSQDGTTWGEWYDFYVGDYVAKAFKFKIELYSKNVNIRPIVASFNFTIDMPDRVEKGNGITLPANGSNITFSSPFQDKPNTQITIVNALAGDTYHLTNETRYGFNLQIKNNGVGVSRNINWLSQGF